MAHADIVSRKVDGRTTVWAAREYIDALIEAGIGSPAVFINTHASNIIDDVTRSKITSVTFSIGGRAFRIAAKEYLLSIMDDILGSDSEK